MEHPLSDQQLVETRVDSKTVFEGCLLRVQQDQVRLPDGNLAQREYIVHPGAVVIIAELANGKLLFERQFRYPVGNIFVELPAGKIDPGEACLETAKRELLEETGHEADDWVELGAFHPGIGYSNEKITIFLAQKAREISKPQLDGGEFLEVIQMTLEDARRQILPGYITDGKTLSALYIYELYKHHRG